jgi:hypothetical protein
LIYDELYVTIVPIDDGHFQTPFYVGVRRQDLIFSIHDKIRDELRAARFVGEFFRSNLPTLPLPEAPTISVLEEENLTDLYTRTSRQATDLPRTMFIEFFNRFVEPDSFHGVHFLVWLPPADREFLFGCTYPMTDTVAAKDRFPHAIQIRRSRRTGE